MFFGDSPTKSGKGPQEDDFVDVCSVGDENTSYRRPDFNTTSAQVQSLLSVTRHLGMLDASTLHSALTAAAAGLVPSSAMGPTTPVLQEGPTPAAGTSTDKTTVSRKEKSLGKLCKRFLLAMEEESRSGEDVHLETVAKKMSESEGGWYCTVLPQAICISIAGVEKRRIYDIVGLGWAEEGVGVRTKSKKSLGDVRTKI
jgi:E2F/DP family winged-helix DNA-binding domain